MADEEDRNMREALASIPGHRPSRRQLKLRGSADSPVAAWEDKIQQDLLALRVGDKDAARDILLSVPNESLTTATANRILVRANKKRFAGDVTAKVLYDTFIEEGGLSQWRTRKLRAARRIETMKAREPPAKQHVLQCPQCRKTDSYHVCQKAFGVRIDCCVCLRENIESDYCRFTGCAHVLCAGCAARMISSSRPA